MLRRKTVSRIVAGNLWTGVSDTKNQTQKPNLGVNIGGLQPISRDTDNNATMYNCWWTNKRS